MFPVRDQDGRILGFAGRGTHLGPSWSLWVTSPANGLYRPSEAVFGLDRAAREIAASSTALVRPDSIEVLGPTSAGERTRSPSTEPGHPGADGVRLPKACPGASTRSSSSFPGMRADRKSAERPLRRRTGRGPTGLPPCRRPDLLTA